MTNLVQTPTDFNIKPHKLAKHIAYLLSSASYWQDDWALELDALASGHEITVKPHDFTLHQTLKITIKEVSDARAKLQQD